MAVKSEAAIAHKREYNRAYAKERYSWLLDHGFCVTCGCAYTEPGFTRCKACATRRAKWRSDNDPGNVRFNARRNAKRAALRAAGLCPNCGAKADGGYVMCEVCRMKQRTKETVNRIQQRIQREADNARRGVYT